MIVYYISERLGAVAESPTGAAVATIDDPP